METFSPEPGAALDAPAIDPMVYVRALLRRKWLVLGCLSVVVAVAQKVVSKAEGAIVDLRTIEPSALARSWAREWGKDPRLIELILGQSRRIVKMDRGILVAETRHGFVCANAGVDCLQLHTRIVRSACQRA